MSKKSLPITVEGFEPDFDLQKYLPNDGFEVHGVKFRHYDLIQSLVYMSSFIHRAVKGDNPLRSNTVLITVDPKNESILCSAGNYVPPYGSEDESNSAIVHGESVSYFLTNGFLLDNFEFCEPQSDYITEEGEILITRKDIETITTPHI